MIEDLAHGPAALLALIAFLFLSPALLRRLRQALRWRPVCGAPAPMNGVRIVRCQGRPFHSGHHVCGRQWWL